ncbi:MAG: hypothetical protein FRX48_00150 [Lasallia pustulata]|uniref:Rhodopsin domain-containing protein n=1 Tax=Lasallia pustulata TaxID=136370 RepID=A0A5M8Q2K1_9LECA|nr:MAG: hypothetical protein FRX48_00150 [Lasallia pustulata]
MASADLPPELSFSGNGGSYPPHGTISPNNHGAYVVVTTWIMMCLTVLSVLTRLSMRRNLGKDNIAIFIASVLLIVQSVTIHIAVNCGLGRHMASLSEKNFKDYSKAMYTSQIIQILVLCLAKISLVLVFRLLTPSKRMQSTFQAFIIFITLWGVAAIVALALQCQQQHSLNWSSSTCFNQSGLYYANAGISLATDIIIITFPAVIIRKAQITSEQRWAIIAMFSIRVLVCIATIIEIVTFQDYLQSSDRTWHGVDLNIWAQVSMNLSIITACIPLMKPFFKKLQFSLLDSSIPIQNDPYQLRLLSRDECSQSFPQKPPGKAGLGNPLSTVSSARGPL